MIWRTSKWRWINRRRCKKRHIWRSFVSDVLQAGRTKVKVRAWPWHYDANTIRWASASISVPSTPNTVNDNYFRFATNILQSDLSRRLKSRTVQLKRQSLTRRPTENRWTTSGLYSLTENCSEWCCNSVTRQSSLNCRTQMLSMSHLLRYSDQLGTRFTGLRLGTQSGRDASSE